MTHIDAIKRDVAYKRVLSNLGTCNIYIGHALSGLPVDAPPIVRAALKDVQDEIATALEMVAEARLNKSLQKHLEVLADCLAAPGEGSE